MEQCGWWREPADKRLAKAKSYFDFVKDSTQSIRDIFHALPNYKTGEERSTTQRESDQRRSTDLRSLTTHLTTAQACLQKCTLELSAAAAIYEEGQEEEDSKRSRR